MILFLFMTLVSNVQGETIIAWDFEGYTGEEKTGEAIEKHPFFMVTDSSLYIRRGPGIKHVPNNNRFNANSWAEADLISALSQGDYFEWEIVPDPGCRLTLTSITMKLERSSTGPSFFTLRSSQDHFESDLGTWEISNTSAIITVDLSSLEETDSRILFRLYGYGNSSAAGSAGFEGVGKDLIVEGTLVSKVPLPQKLAIPTASDSSFSIYWNSPEGLPGTDWSGFYLFVSVNAPNALNGDILSQASLFPHQNLQQASCHEGSYCVGHIQDTTTISLIVTGIEPGQRYFVTALSYLCTLTDTAWSVQAPERSLQYYSIVINEILADPATDIRGDANGDGSRHASEDEFVELVNTSDMDADLSSWMIKDEESIRHIFPFGTIIPPGGIFVVFGGGAPNLPETDAQIYLASSGSFSLNNSNESLSLLTFDSTLIDSHQWGSEGGQDQSMVRNPALYGPFVLHTTFSGTDLFSPGIITNYENSLPVSLSYFSGNASGYTVNLTWTTESEIDNAGFSITRQYEENDPILLANFTSNPALKGHGSTTERNTYHFTDYPTEAGIYQYWLSNHSYSGETTAHFHKKVRIPYGLSINPYPNPFNAIFHIPLRLVEQQPVEITVINLLGQTILSEALILPSGNHEIPVNMESFQSGIYLLHVKTKDNTYVNKMIYLK